jgi:hypothetical protein
MPSKLPAGSKQTAADVKPGSDRNLKRIRRELIGTKRTVSFALFLLASSWFIFELLFEPENG